MLIVPCLAGLRRCSRSSCTSRKVSSSMMAGWVSLNICHSPCGRSSRFLFLKDLLVVWKLTVSPIYSCRERIFPTVPADQRYGTVDSRRYGFPMLCQYSVGVITLSAFSFLAICVGPNPATLISKIHFTTSAAGSSTSHSFGLSGFFCIQMAGWL